MEKNSVRPLDAIIVSLLRPFEFECVRDTGSVPIYITDNPKRSNIERDVAKQPPPRRDILSPNKPITKVTLHPRLTHTSSCFPYQVPLSSI